MDLSKGRQQLWLWLGGGNRTLGKGKKRGKQVIADTRRKLYSNCKRTKTMKSRFYYINFNQLILKMPHL